MQELTTDRLHIDIDAPPEQVFALVSDIGQMCRFSPELVSVRWLDGADGPEVGARFEAVNQVPGRGRTWRNRPVVTVHDPPRSFAVSRTEPLAGTIVWRYDVTAAAGGTRLTESYEVERPVSRLGWFVMEKVYGATGRAGSLRAGMEQTLARIKVAAEGTGD